MLIEATGKPFTYRWPDGEVRLEFGRPVELPEDRARKLLAKAPSKVRVVASLAVEAVDTVTDAYQSVYAVKIGGSVVGEFWFCLSETEPFDPGDGLPVYRPQEVKALKGKGYGPQELLAVHKLKTAFNGQVEA